VHCGAEKPGRKSGHALTAAQVLAGLVLGRIRPRGGGRARADRTRGNGNAGDVDITVGRMRLTGGAQIGSTSGMAPPEGNMSVGTGKAGVVTDTATSHVV
jgi:hypothetical protein